MRKYKLTDEHRAQLKPCADKWIANALSTKAMDDDDRAAMRVAVRGLYESAGLTPPPNHRIVFVPSPFVLRFAGGAAAWIWHCKQKHGSATDAATRVATLAATDAATYAAARAATDAATRVAALAATYDATDAATLAAANDATLAATYAATSAATRVATDAAALAATYAATRVATDAATVDATSDATRAATSVATSAATRVATYAATSEATEAARRTVSSTFYAAGSCAEAALRIAGNGALKCAELAYSMWNGGNQWSAWVACLSFFRHVAKLPISYDKWEHYERAAIHGGPRIMHPEFCMISDRPAEIHMDDERQPHNETGMAVRWRDGTGLWAIHGHYVPGWIVEHPERITVESIRKESNAETKRIMRERYGEARYLAEIGAKVIDTDLSATHTRRKKAPAIMRALLEDDEQRRFLVGTDGSTGRTYHMEVPNTVGTCRAAHEFLSGINEDNLIGQS